MLTACKKMFHYSLQKLTLLFLVASNTFALVNIYDTISFWVIPDQYAPSKYCIILVSTVFRWHWPCPNGHMW